MYDYDVIIIGAGAAGLMTALVAGRRGLKVLVIEHANKPGKKILMSGGGRCNFTNMYAEPDNYLSDNPDFCKSALARYTPWNFIAMVEQHGIAFHEKEAGQLFCDQSSKQILNMLLRECSDAQVELRLNCPALGIERLNPGFAIRLSTGTLNCPSLVVATGGLSIPKMGASGFGYDLARRWGHEIVATRAGLVPLTLSGSHLENYSNLSGLSTDACVSKASMHFRSPVLITHRGLSGPAILQISSYWQPGESLELDWIPETNAQNWLSECRNNAPRKSLANHLASLIPKRLAERLCILGRWPQTLDNASDAQLNQIAEQLTHWPLPCSGTEGYRTAEVTLGGVDTRQISSRTMESTLVPGLYLVGEVVDVTGQLGGFNFQWAWASGNAAGEQV